MGASSSKNSTGEYKMQCVGNLMVCAVTELLGGSGGVVNSLDFCQASLKSLGCFYFQCILSSQWKAVTMNLLLVL